MNVEERLRLKWQNARNQSHKDKVASRILAGLVFFILLIPGVNPFDDSQGMALAVPPAPPSFITPTAGDKQVVINWNSVTGATSYNLYWSTVPEGTKSTGTKITNVRSPYTHTGLTNFTTYYYILSSVNTDGEGEGSAAVPATPKGPPSAPTEVTLTDEGDREVTIAWKSVNGATSYNIYYGMAPGITKSNGTKILNVTSPHTHKGLINLTPYYYVVTAVNSTYGESAVSSEVSASAKGTPYAPSIVRATDNSDGQIVIVWNSVSNAASYNIYWSLSPGVTTSNGAKIPVNSVYYAHSGLTNLARYYYIITAVNTYGEGEPSPEVSETPTSSGVTIKYGQGIQGSIEAVGQTKQYKFHGLVGDQIVFSMSTVSNGSYTSEPDAYIRVYGPDDLKICEIYREIGGLEGAANAEMICSLPASGVYTILAGDYGGNSTGNYSLYIQRLNKPGNSTSLAFGQTLSSTTLTMAGKDTYTFFASADDKIIFSMSTVSNGSYISEPDAHIRVYGPDGLRICETYREIGGLEGAANAEMTCSLPARGSYTILVGDYGGNSTGNYSLYVQRLNKPGNTTSLAFGQTLSSTTLTMAGKDTYTFFASADDKVIVSMTTVSNGSYTGEPDAHIRVYEPGGWKLYEIYRELGGLEGAANAEMTCSLPVSGTYTILVGDYGGNSTGRYSVSLSCLAGICGGYTTYDILATAGVNGTINPSGLITMNMGSDQTFSILPNANCNIADVLVDGASIGAVTSYTFHDISANHTIETIFGGTKLLMSITVQGEQSQMSAGSTQTLTATGHYSDGTSEPITSAAWMSLDTNVATVDVDGVVTAVAAGSTSITATYGGKAGAKTITVDTAAAKQHQGNLILVAGGGIAADNTLRDSTQYLADLVYSRFRNRLFSDADIYYFNPKSWHDIDGDGYRDRIVDDDIPTVEKFGQAITQWAAGRNNDGPLYIYLIDHGGIDQFLIFPGQILTSSQFKGYLDTFQNATNRKVVVVMEACKSGSFVDDLTINPVTQQRISNRIVVTSADDKDSYMQLSGRISFTQFFIDKLLAGDSLYQGYLKTKQQLANLGLPYSLMKPQLLEEVTKPSAQTFVGGDFAIAPIYPQITAQSPDSVIGGCTVHGFYAELSNLEGIESVWAVVVPPDYVAPSLSGEFASPEVSLPIFELTDPQGDGRFERTYGDFRKNGEYQITFYGRNNLGNIAASAPTRILVEGAVEPGDVNGDGLIDVHDAIVALQVMAGRNQLNESSSFACADVNGDGKIGMAEVIYILQKAATLR
jgi:hypothetical protein